MRSKAVDGRVRWVMRVRKLATMRRADTAGELSIRAELSKARDEESEDPPNLPALFSVCLFSIVDTCHLRSLSISFTSHHSPGHMHTFKVIKSCTAF